MAMNVNNNNDGDDNIMAEVNLTPLIDITVSYTHLTLPTKKRV